MGKPPRRDESPDRSWPRLVDVSERDPGSVYPLAGRELTLGRVSTNDIHIPDRRVSRVHARIERRNDSCTLFDLKSRNGMLVNDRPVRERVLEHGDEIRIADRRYRFLTTPDEKPMELSHPARAASAAPVPIAPAKTAPIPTAPVPAAPASSPISPEASEGERTITFRMTIPVDDSAAGSKVPVPGPGVATDRLLQRIDVLRDLVLLTTLDTDLLEVLRRIADRLRGCFQAERVCVLLPDGSPPRVAPVALSVCQPCATGTAPSRTIIDRVLEERSALLCADALTDASFGDADSVTGLSIRSVMCAPLLSRGRLRGVLYLDSSSHSEEFDETDLWLLKVMAGHLAVLVENFELLSGMRREVQCLREETTASEPSMIGHSPAVRRVITLARKTADSDATILILGESGTGKEVLARSIHRWSRRCERPFVIVNCAALSGELLQSDLFGHEQGAFTGAVRLKKGRLELADQGTVFLDEIGEMGPEIQSRLLRFLQERQFERVGGTRPIRVDIRIIAATNRDLAAEVRAGRFREDLYFRLRVIEIGMPALRERTDDIALLATEFLREFSRPRNAPCRGLTAGALAQLREYSWPGNIRELRNSIERAVVLATGEEIDAEDLDLGPAPPHPPDDATAGGFHSQVRAVKKRIIREAIEEAGGVQQAAAQRLGLRASYLSRLMRNLEMR
jgi:Nif-specific regulatory protein